MRRHPLPEPAPPAARADDRDRDCHDLSLLTIRKRERGAAVAPLSSVAFRQSVERVFLRLRYFSLSSNGTNRIVMRATATPAHSRTTPVARSPRPALSAQLGSRP